MARYEFGIDLPDAYFKICQFISQLLEQGTCQVWQTLVLRNLFDEGDDLAKLRRW